MVLAVEEVFDFLRDGVFFPVKLEGIFQENQLKKKIIPLIQGWTMLKKPIKDKTRYSNGVALKLGFDSGVYVLDLDEKKDFDIIRKQYPEVENCYVITKKGFHLYFEWTKKTQELLGSRNFKRSNGYKSDIDFLGEKKCVIAPPSFYECNNKKFQYTFGAKNKLKKMSLNLMNYLISEYQTKSKKEIKKEKQVDKILNQYFQTNYLWHIEEQENSYKITNNSLECLIDGEHNEPSHSCIYANFNGEIIINCFSHGIKKIDIPELVNFLQIGENIKIKEQENYYYNDYKKFESEILFSSSGGITPMGRLFMKYYKSVFCRVDNEGRTLYFCKIKKGNNEEWRAIKDNPFSSKSSKFYVKEKNGDKIKMKPITDFIMNCITKEHITTADKIDFLPYLKTPPKTDEVILNTFCGYTFKYNNKDEDFIIKEELKEKMDITKDHIENIICNGDDKTIKYFYSWISHLIQKPMSKDGIPAIILKSGQGTGKNLICNFLCNIINPAYTIILTNFDKLTGKFNNVLENKLLTICNEISSFGGDFRQNDKLKSIITDTKQIIEPKGQDAYTINNYSRFMFLTKDDRRYFCIEVSDKRKGDTEYYKKLAEAYQDKDIQQLYFNFLSNFEITENIRIPPMNKFKASMKWRNRDNLPIKHLTEYIHENTRAERINEVSDFYTTKTLYEEFKEWCIQEGERPNITLRSYSLILNKFKFEKVRKRIDGSKNQTKGFIITKEILKKVINDNIDEDYEIGDDVE